MSHSTPAGKAVPAVHVVDEPDKVGNKAADDNNLARMCVPGFDAEVERLHRKFGEVDEKNGRLELDNKELREEKATLTWRLKRRGRALCTGFVALEANAIYCMSTDAWGTDTWWANAGQAAAGLTIGLYLFWPNLKTLVKLSSDPRLRISKDFETK